MTRRPIMSSPILNPMRAVFFCCSCPLGVQSTLDLYQHQCDRMISQVREPGNQFHKQKSVFILLIEQTSFTAIISLLCLRGFRNEIALSIPLISGDEVFVMVLLYENPLIFNQSIDCFVTQYYPQQQQQNPMKKKVKTNHFCSYIDLLANATNRKQWKSKKHNHPSCRFVNKILDNNYNKDQPEEARSDVKRGIEASIFLKNNAAETQYRSFKQQYQYIKELINENKRMELALQDHLNEQPSCKYTSMNINAVTKKTDLGVQIIKCMSNGDLAAGEAGERGARNNLYQIYCEEIFKKRSQRDRIEKGKRNNGISEERSRTTSMTYKSVRHHIKSQKKQKHAEKSDKWRSGADQKQSSAGKLRYNNRRNDRQHFVELKGSELDQVSHQTQETRKSKFRTRSLTKDALRIKDICRFSIQEDHHNAKLCTIHSQKCNCSVKKLSPKKFQPSELNIQSLNKTKQREFMAEGLGCRNINELRSLYKHHQRPAQTKRLMKQGKTIVNEVNRLTGWAIQEKLSQEQKYSSDCFGYS